MGGRCDLSRPVNACVFLFREMEEQLHSLFFPVEQMCLCLVACSYPAPCSRQACLAEQCLGDLHGIVAGHVSGRVSAFDIELVRLSEHGTKTRDFGHVVQ